MPSEELTVNYYTRQILFWNNLLVLWEIALGKPGIKACVCCSYQHLSITNRKYNFTLIPVQIAIIILYPNSDRVWLHFPTQKQQ